MKLKSFNFLLGLLIILFSLPVKGEDKIDIWKNKKKEENTNISAPIQQKEENQIEINQSKKSNSNEKILIEDDLNKTEKEIKIFGIYDPAEFNFDLNMWSSTEADEVRASIKRLKKINLSKTSNQILENILLSFSYPPKGMSDKEFVKLKINWLVDNDRQD